MWPLAGHLKHLVLTWYFAFKDFVVPSKIIMQQWQARKIASKQCLHDLIRSRCPRAVTCSMVVRALADQELEIEQQTQIGVLLEGLEKTLGAFRSHPEVQRWIDEHRADLNTPHFRARCLLLRGPSRAGKTQKAMSLFGYKATLVVNCQGLGTNLPSLREYDRARHSAIVWDEVDEGQVLANKLVFQCGAWPVQLSQSVCNQHSYQRWFYNCAMILCSNTFRTTQQDGLASAEAEDWLQANLVDARLPLGQAWYEQPEPARMAGCAFSCV